MSAVLDSKLRKALDLRTDAPTMTDALDCMAGFWGQNTLEARRGLRTQLEHQNVVLAEDFIAAFSPLQVSVATGILEWNLWLPMMKTAWL